MFTATPNSRLTFSRSSPGIQSFSWSAAPCCGRTNKRLTFYELEVLKLLREKSEETVSRDELLEKVWGIQASPTSRTVDNFIVKLRRKLEEDQKNPRHILTVYGLGYKLVP